MDLPFTREEFTRTFVTYNEGIWPMQIFAWALGAALVGIIFRGRAWSAQVVLAGLSAIWAWTGVEYHMLHFALVNPAAYAFGIGFAVEGFLLALFALRPSHFTFRSSFDAVTVAGWVLIAYGLIIYPVAALLWTHPYPATPMFGVTPCPTVIFTMGVLLLVEPRPHWLLFVLPCTWAIVGGSAAILLDVPEDWALFAVPVGWLVAVRRRTSDLRT